MTCNSLSKSVNRRSKTESAQYLWDINHGLPQVLTESDGKGTTLYSYGLGRISMADPRKGQMYYQYDGLGSVRGLTDRKGMTKGLYAYDAFGKPLISASPVDNDFQYTGEQVDDETGLIYLRSRYYDPEIGRFISRDSFPGFDTATQSLNRYTYTYNNPVLYTDPSGKVVWWVPGVAGAAVSGAWYAGGVGVTYATTGQWTGSWCKFGGALAGGAVAPYAALVSGNPFAAAGAAGAAYYTADTKTQEVLSNLGVSGETEQFSWGGLTLAAVGSSLTGGFTNLGPNRGRNPTSIWPALTGKEMQHEVKQNILDNTVQTPWNVITDYAQQNSNQGPIRLGSGSIALPGGKLY